MADIVTNVDLTELALRAQDQEIASLRKELRDTKLDHSSEVYDLREEIQNLREALNKYEQSATVDRHGFHEQLQDEEMEDEYSSEMEDEYRSETGDGYPSISHESMNQQTHQASYGAELSIDPTLQAGQESYAQIGVDPAPNEFLDRQARLGVYDLQASVEATSHADQESPAQSVDLGPNTFHHVPTSRQFVQPTRITETHAQSEIEIPADAYQTSKYLQANGLSPSILESYMESTVGLAYDPLWYRRIGINVPVPTNSRSARKLTDIFAKVFQAGDRFWVRLQLDDQWTQRCATVKSLKPRMLFIEPSHNGSYGVDCEVGASLASVYSAILKEHTGTATATYTGTRSYDDIDVYRQGVYLGDLSTIRQWHHLWTDDFDLWTVKTGNFRLRGRRSLPSNVEKGSLTWSRGIWLEKLPNGGSRPSANQLLFASGTKEKMKEGEV